MGRSVIATGTPEEVSQVKESFTGRYLKKVLEEEGKIFKPAENTKKKTSNLKLKKK